MTEQPEIVKVFLDWLREASPAQAERAIAAVLRPRGAAQAARELVVTPNSGGDLPMGAPSFRGPFIGAGERTSGPLAGLRYTGWSTPTEYEQAWSYDVDGIYVEPSPSHERAIAAGGVLTESQERWPIAEGGMRPSAWAPGRTTYILRARVAMDALGGDPSAQHAIVFTAQARRFRARAFVLNGSIERDHAATVMLALDTPTEVTP